MAALESESSFIARATAIGLTAPLIQNLKDANLLTFGKFAFSCSHQPGGNDEQPLIDMVKTVIGREPVVSELALFRRLFFESHTLALSDMRSRIERTDEDVPKRLPPPERQARRLRQLAAYPGLDIVGELDPANQLIDKCCQQLEDGVLRYIPLHDCPTREQEILRTRKDPSFTFDSNGNLKATKQENTLKSDITSDLKVKNAMCRRALAYDQSGLATYTVLDKWTSKVFHVLAKEVPQGYKRVSMEQVIAADKQLFLQVAEDTRASLAPTPGAPKPMDTAFLAAINDPQVIYCLLPLPESHHNQPKSTSNDRSEPYKPSPIKKGGGKGDNKGKPRTVFSDTSKKFNLPEGCVSMHNGKPLCFNFNNGRCTAVKPGKRCRFGFHLCYKHGCGKQEPFVSCKH